MPQPNIARILASLSSIFKSADPERLRDLADSVDVAPDRSAEWRNISMIGNPGIGRPGAASGRGASEMIAEYSDPQIQNLASDMAERFGAMLEDAKAEMKAQMRAEIKAQLDPIVKGLSGLARLHSLTVKGAEFPHDASASGKDEENEEEENEEERDTAKGNPKAKSREIDVPSGVVGDVLGLINGMVASVENSSRTVAAPPSMVALAKSNPDVHRRVAEYVATRLDASQAIMFDTHVMRLGLVQSGRAPAHFLDWKGAEVYAEVMANI